MHSVGLTINLIYKFLGSTKEKIPAIGIGTWAIDRNGIEAIRYFIEHDSGLIDTAEMYGTEGIVAESIKGYDRSKVFIIDKVWTNHLSHDACIKACEASLRRLGTSYIDLYLVHWPSYEVPISETMRAFEELIDAGKVRHIGVSNFSIEQFEEAQASLKRTELVANEIKFNIIEKRQAMEFIEYAKKSKITVIAYSPLVRGIENISTSKGVYAKLLELSNKYNKTVAQIALNWVISHEQVVAIPKTSKLEHAKENLEAANFNLSEKEIKELDSMGSV